MPFDAFISYSTKDKPIADAACATLESRGVRCWIAPRDILPGEEWPAAIVKGIEQSRLMVLIYSGSANESSQIKRELERAVARNMPILPFRLDEAPMSPSMQYLISTPHWLDAINPPMEAHLKRLGDTVASLLAGMGGGGGSTQKKVEQGGGKTLRVDRGAVEPRKAGGQRRTALVAFCLLLLVIGVGVLWHLFKNSSSGPGPGPVGNAAGGPAAGAPATPGTPSTFKAPAPVDPTPPPTPAVTPPPTDPDVALAKLRGETVEANGDTFVREGKYAEAVLEYEAALREYPGLKGVAEKLKAAQAMAAKKSGTPAVTPPADPPVTPPVKLEPLIFAAVKGNNLAAAQTIIKGDPKAVFARDSEGRTPLHVLAENPYGTLYMTRLLTDNHADPHAKDNAGRTPLDIAKASNSKSVKAILDQILTTRPSPK